MSTRDTCPTACVEANHRGIEHDEWLTRLTAAGDVLFDDLIAEKAGPIDPNGEIWDHAADLASLLPGNKVQHLRATLRALVDGLDANPTAPSSGNAGQVGDETPELCGAKPPAHHPTTDRPCINRPHDEKTPHHWEAGR